MAARSKRLTASVPARVPRPYTGHAGLLKLRREVFGEHACDQPPEDVIDNERMDPTVRFAKRDQASDPETFEHCGREFSTGKPESGAVQQLGILL